MKALVIAAVLLAAAAGPASGQRSVRIVGGLATGIVTDSVTGHPVSYALVTLWEGTTRVFAAENGRFRLGDLKPGLYQVTVAQLGYAPVAALVRFTPDSAPGISPELVFRLSRRAIVLPELVVTASAGCREGTRGDLSDLSPTVTAVLENAERILALERFYPFQSVFLVQSTQFDTTGRRREGKPRTIMTTTAARNGYRQGKVVEGGGRTINYFTTSDLARPEFRRHHCFWPAGVDTVAGVPTVRIAFAPTLDVATPDWEGSLRADVTTARLARSEARLINLDTSRMRLRYAGCVVLYGEVLPTLLHEGQAECATTEARTRWSMTRDTWRVVSIRFLRRRPGDPE